jgi:hypothetical protein
VRGETGQGPGQHLVSQLDEGQQRLADARAGQGKPSPDTWGQRQGLVAVDLFDVDHVVPLPDAEVHGLVNGLEEVLEERQRRLPQVEPARHQWAQLE